MGVITVARFFQRALNAMNLNQQLYKDILVDGGWKLDVPNMSQIN